MSIPKEITETWKILIYNEIPTLSNIINYLGIGSNKDIRTKGFKLSEEICHIKDMKLIKDPYYKIYHSFLLYKIDFYRYVEILYCSDIEIRSPHIKTFHVPINKNIYDDIYFNRINVIPIINNSLFRCGDVLSLYVQPEWSYLNITPIKVIISKIINTKYDRFIKIKFIKILSKIGDNETCKNL